VEFTLTKIVLLIHSVYKQRPSWISMFFPIGFLLLEVARPPHQVSSAPSQSATPWSPPPFPFFHPSNRTGIEPNQWGRWLSGNLQNSCAGGPCPCVLHETEISTTELSWTKSSQNVRFGEWVCNCQVRRLNRANDTSTITVGVCISKNFMSTNFLCPHTKRRGREIYD
jgi:hypothetical protein